MSRGGYRCGAGNARAAGGHALRRHPPLEAHRPAATRPERSRLRVRRQVAASGLHRDSQRLHRQAFRRRCAAPARAMDGLPLRRHAPMVRVPFVQREDDAALLVPSEAARLHCVESRRLDRVTFRVTLGEMSPHPRGFDSPRPTNCSKPNPSRLGFLLPGTDQQRCAGSRQRGRQTIRSTARNASAWIVRLGASPPPELGKTLASQMWKLPKPCTRRFASTTEWRGSLPMRQVPNTCAEEKWS